MGVNSKFYQLYFDIYYTKAPSRCILLPISSSGQELGMVFLIPIGLTVWIGIPYQVSKPNQTKPNPTQPNQTWFFFIFKILIIKKTSSILVVVTIIISGQFYVSIADDGVLSSPDGNTWTVLRNFTLIFPDVLLRDVYSYRKVIHPSFLSLFPFLLSILSIPLTLSLLLFLLMFYTW